MTQKEILEGNKLISKFKGWEFDNHSHTYRLGDLIMTELNFHKDWNLLIPVVEKIEILGFRWEMGMSLTHPYHYCKIWSIGTIEGISPVDAIYGAIVEFITWYNDIYINNK